MVKKMGDRQLVELNNLQLGLKLIFWGQSEYQSMCTILLFLLILHIVRVKFDNSGNL